MRLFLLAIVLSVTAAEACEMMAFKRVKASPHVHVFEAAEGTTGVVNGNIAVVIGNDAALVVDTGQILGTARKVVDEIRALTKLPVRYIVNTHWHGDHILGNATFKRAFPEARIVAHPFTVEEGGKRYADYAVKTAQTLPVVLDNARKRREASTSDDERLWLARTIECGEKILPDVPDTHYLAADTLVEREMTVDLGGLPVVIRHVGTGNTAGDLVVWVEQDRLVATGDMVVYPAPYAIGANALDMWAGTLAQVRSLGATTFVPGHGPVMRDDRYLRDVEVLLISTRRQIADMRAQGAARADAASKLDTSEFRARYIDTPMRRQAFEQFFVKAAIAANWPAN
jgi:glyoxylase-like metal-dependent hydrolase (beta-lactamase superfamily II)